MTAKSRWRRFPLLAALALGGMVVVQILFDPLEALGDAFSVARLRADLPRAMARWQAQDIHDYRLEIRGAAPLVCLVDGEITVSDDQLVELRLRKDILTPSSGLRPVAEADWRRSSCKYEDLTVARMFERVARQVQEAGVLGGPLRVQFDAERGFITQYRYGRSAYGGLLGPTVSECCTWFEFTNLRSIAP
ncbi:MAG TPA: hypothetical protein VFI11_08260 [Anaerolineales bacterium]|nr:hypothetical protein [Anaerolineales bacterium]